MTPEQRVKWEASWNEPHMIAGLEALKEKSRVPGQPTPVVPGIDLREVASQAYAFAQGQNNILDEIEKMKPAKQAPPLPPAFQPTPKPKQETD